MASGFKVAFDGRIIDIEDMYLAKTYLTNIWNYENNILGTQYGFGSNIYGQLGDNTIISKSSPVQTISSGSDWVSVASGLTHSAGIKSDGTLWLWGRNRYGEIGNNTASLTIGESSPVQTVSLGNDWVSVDLGFDFSGGIKSAGTLWTWGLNDRGQLGTGGGGNRSSPTQIGTSLSWKQVSLGYRYGAAVTSSNLIYSWGTGSFGNLGIGNQVSTVAPVQTLGDNYDSVDCGYFFSTSVKLDGSIWSWGQNGAGQLGDNTAINRSRPVQIMTGGFNWLKASNGNSHAAGLKTDGTLWLWGANNVGQLGDGTTVSKSSPVQTLAAGNDWVGVKCGLNHTIGIKQDGSFWTWGLNTSGQLGIGDALNRSSPIQMGIAKWLIASGGGSHTNAIYSL